MSNTVLVTGATGKTGRRLVPLLACRGVTVRAATRDPDTMIQDAQTVWFDWRDPGTYAPALDGVHALYLVSSHYSDGTIDPSDQVAAFVQAAAGRPVRYVETDADWIRRHLLDGGASPEFAGHVAELTTSSVGGDFMATVTGRAPTAFADYARTAAPAWRRHASLAPGRTAP